MANGNCPSCGTAMVPMIFSSFCPNDCDRTKAGEAADLKPPPDGPWRAYDLGIAWIDPKGRSWYVYSYSFNSCKDPFVSGVIPPGETRFDVFGQYEYQNFLSDKIKHLDTAMSTGLYSGDIWGFDENRVKGILPLCKGEHLVALRLVEE